MLSIKLIWYSFVSKELVSESILLSKNERCAACVGTGSVGTSLGRQIARPKLLGPPHRMRPVAVDGTALLECSVENAAFYTWRVRLQGRSGSVDLRKLLDMRLTGADERILQIRNVELDDSGNYTCEPVSGATTKSEPITFELIVFDPLLDTNASRVDPRRCTCSIVYDTALSALIFL